MQNTRHLKDRKSYTYMHKPLYEGDFTTLWNETIHTDREVAANRPDITITTKKGKTCTLINVAIPSDRKVVQKEAEFKLKYKSLGIEIQRMLNLESTTIPVISGATGILTKSLRKILEAIPGKH
jgi:hypothetical protein